LLIQVFCTRDSNWFHVWRCEGSHGLHLWGMYVYVCWTSTQFALANLFVVS
jgi:hypothetical protein